MGVIKIVTHNCDKFQYFMSWPFINQNAEVASLKLYHKVTFDKRSYLVTLTGNKRQVLIKSANVLTISDFYFH